MLKQPSIMKYPISASIKDDFFSFQPVPFLASSSDCNGKYKFYMNLEYERIWIHSTVHLN